MERVEIWWEVHLVIHIQAFLNTTCLPDTAFVAIYAHVQVGWLGDSGLKKPPGGYLEERVFCDGKQDKRLEDLIIKSVSNLLELK
jgi:hypothetical protein